MNDTTRHLRGLLKLLSLARRHVDAAGLRLTSLERSKSDVSDALALLEAAIRSEEAVALGRTEITFRDFAGYLAGAGAKRLSLVETCRSIDAEIDAARAALVAAELERRKLEHLVDLAATALKKRRAKRDNAKLDDAGRRLAGRA